MPLQKMGYHAEFGWCWLKGASTCKLLYPSRIGLLGPSLKVIKVIESDTVRSDTYDFLSVIVIFIVISDQ